MSLPKKLAIVGAGDHGRGTLEILKACNRDRLQFEPVGFVDDNPALRGSRIDGIPILGTIDSLSVRERSALHFVIGIANCGLKQRLASRLESATFATLIHPSAVIGSDVLIHDGTIIAAGVVVAYSTAIGSHVTLNLNATVGHDCQIGNYTTVAPGANVAGKAHLGEGCDISLNATIVRGISLGDWTVAGPGAVVLEDVPAGQTIFGNPGRRVPTLGPRRTQDDSVQLA